MHRGDLHRVGDRRRAAVQRSAEDVREAQHVVDLVRVVAAPGGDDRVVANGAHLVGQDLRRRVGQREDHRVRGHRGHHVGLEHAAGRQPQEHVGARHHLGQGAQAGGLCELRLVGVHQFGAALPDHAGQVGDPDVLALQPQLQQQPQAGQCRSTGAAGHQLDLANVLAHHLQRIQQRRADDDGGAMLVVVEDGDLQPLAQLALDDEAVRRLDVLQVDATEGGLQRGDHLDQLVDVLLVDLDVEDIDVGELLEQHRLAFHHRLGGQRPDVTQAEHGRAVGDHCHQVAARGVAKGIRRVGDDLLAGRGHAGRVGQCQVVLVDHLLGRGNGQLAWYRKLVVLERGLSQFGGLVLVLGHGAVLRNALQGAGRQF